MLVTDGSELFYYDFSRISHFLERTLMEYVDIKNRLDSKLDIYCIYSIRIRSRKQDIFEKPQQRKILVYFCGPKMRKFENKQK